MHQSNKIYISANTKYLVICILSILIIYSFAQYSQPKFERISLMDGLSQSSVLSITQDHQGYMWFATQEGLNRYNGYDFTVYKHDPNLIGSISDNWINIIYEDSRRNLWIGTAAGGLEKFNRRNESFIHHRHQPSQLNSLPHPHVRTIIEDRHGNLWIGTYGGGLCRMDRDSGKFYPYHIFPDDSVDWNHNKITALCEDQDGMIWAATDGAGLFRIDPAVFSSSSSDSLKYAQFRYSPNSSNGLSSNHILSLLSDHDGNIWIGTAGSGLDIYDPRKNRFTNFRVNHEKSGSLTDNQIESLFQDNAGIIWIGTDGGLHRYFSEKNSFHLFTHQPNNKHSLSNNQIRDIYEDRSGILWIGTFGGGLNKFNKNVAFTNYNHNSVNDNSLIDNTVWAILEDRRGDLWVGTNKGLDQFSRQKEIFIHHQAKTNVTGSLTHPVVRVLFEDHNGILWVGTDGGGLNRLDKEFPGKFTAFMHEPSDTTSLSDNRVRTIFEDRHQVLWIGSWNGLNRLDLSTQGVSPSNPVEFKKYYHNPKDPSSISDNRVRCIYQDNNGALWVGTYGGLNYFDRTKNSFISFLHNSTNQHSLSHDRVLCLYEDTAGRFWIGTYGGGLNLFDRETYTFYHYNENHGLPNSTVYGILEDQKGYLWLSTNKGLSRFDPDNVQFKNYDFNDGLQSNEFNGGAYGKTRSGELIFGGINGFTMFNPQQVRNNPHTPPVVITSFKKYDENISFYSSDDTTDKIELSYTDRFFSVEFAALDYTNPRKNLYAYKLEGFDEDWIYSGNRRYVSYTNLDGGEYTFHVKASNNDGIWNEQGTTLEFRINPPFWEKAWFRILLGIFIVFTGYSTYQIRVRQVKLRNKKLHQEVAQRTFELNRNTIELLLAKKETDDILNNVEEGLFLLDEKYTIAANHSKALKSILSSENLAQSHFLNLLSNKLPELIIDQTREFLELMFQESIDEESLRELNPLSDVEVQFTNREGRWETSKNLSFKFKRIKDNNNSLKLIATVEDRTEQVKLSRQLKQTEERNRRQMEWLVNVLHVEPVLLDEFIEGVQRELDYIGSLLKEKHVDGSLHSILESMYRSMHMIKGNASLLDLQFFSNAAHDFEEVISEVKRKQRIQGKDFVSLVIRLSNMQQSLNEIKKLIERIQQFHKHFRPKRSYEADILIRSLNNFVINLAKELQKEVQFNHDNFHAVSIPYRYRLLVKEILIQLIRNALHHGIEKPDERKLLNKPPAGIVSLSVRQNEKTIVLNFRDDGRGIDIKKLRKQALDSGRWDLDEIASWNDLEIARLIFEPGFTTVEQADTIAGRGIGMDAIEKKIKQVKGNIEFDYAEGQFCEFTITIPIENEKVKKELRATEMEMDNLQN